MSVNQPINRNFLSPTGFSLVIDKLPTVEYFVQSVNLPGINVPVHYVGTPLIRNTEHGGKLTFNELRVTFKIDEDMLCWKEIYKWMTGLAFPDTTNQYKELHDAPQSAPAKKRGAVFSDLTLIILTSNKNANITIKFRDAFPITLGDIKFESTPDGIDYVTSEVSFAYLLYEFDPSPGISILGS